MTRASHARIAAPAAKFDEPVFAMPTPGMLSEQTDLIAFNLVLGLIHPDDSPILVVAWDGERFRKFLPDQAAKWADELDATAEAEELKPVTDALRHLVKRVGEIVSAAIMRQETVH